MFIKKSKALAFLLICIMVISQGVIFAEVSTNEAVKILGAGVKTELTLTLAALKAMPAEAQIDEVYIYNSKAGEKSVQVKGVSLAYILTQKAGVTAENADVQFVTSDNYSIDPQALQNVLSDSSKYVIAYEIDGQLIDNDGVVGNEEITVYRKVKEVGEFGTVFKMVTQISVGEAKAVVEEPTTPPVVEEPTTSFTDITSAYKFAETAINHLATKEIINGVAEGKFGPEASLTRAQISKILVLALGIEQKPYTGGFSDVKAGDWFAPYVQASVESGLFTGYEDGTFKPEQTINRQELAAVVARGAVKAEKVTAEKMDKFVMSKSSYADKDAVPAWVANEVAWLEAKSVFADFIMTHFDGLKVVNRAEAASAIYNALFKE